MARLRVAVVMNVNSGGLWIVPQAEELRRRAHRVSVVLPPGPGRLRAALVKRGFEVIESPFDFRFRPGVATLSGMWRLRQLIGRLSVDLVYYHRYASALAARFATIGTGLRTVHFVATPRFLETAPIRLLERLLWRLDDVTICGTDHLSRLYRQLGAPGDRVPVVQCGIDVGYFSPPPVASGADPAPADDRDRRAERQAKARAEIGLDDGQFLVTIVGYGYPPKGLARSGRDIKGHDLLLQAWRQFHARHPRSHLLMIGKGFTATGAYRRRFATRFGVDEDPSVTWLGCVPDLGTYLTAADLGIIPSLFEGSDSAVREASPFGLPTIVSDACGLPAAVDYRCGWVVPRGDTAGLARALDAAYREFEAGTLAVRGEHARRRALRLFGDGEAAARVVDIIEATARRGRERARVPWTDADAARRGAR